MFFGAGIEPPSSFVKWYVSVQKFGILYYLAITNQSSTELIWSQRREKAIQYNSASEATIKLEQIKTTKRTKEFQSQLKVI